jgi:hypothetical protein
MSPSPHKTHFLKTGLFSITLRYVDWPFFHAKLLSPLNSLFRHFVWQDLVQKYLPLLELFNLEMDLYISCPQTKQLCLSPFLSL